MVELLRDVVRAWLWGQPGPAIYVRPWNPVIADRYAAATARLLLGAAGPPRVVGNRRDEAILADRERRAAALRRGTDASRRL